VTEIWITPRLTTPTLIRKKKYTAARAVQAGPRTVNREVAVIKAIVQSAVPDFLEVSPLYGMPLLPTTTPQRRLMTEDEEARLLRVMAPDDKALFLLGLDSLIRLMDLLDVKRADDHGATLWIADPKAGGGFAVPISTRARKALNAYYATLPKAAKDDAALHLRAPAHGGDRARSTERHPEDAGGPTARWRPAGALRPARRRHHVPLGHAAHGLDADADARSRPGDGAEGGTVEDARRRARRVSRARRRRGARGRERRWKTHASITLRHALL
jgi:hypothetical protein